jgi:hypothetical protein
VVDDVFKFGGLGNIELIWKFQMRLVLIQKINDKNFRDNPYKFFCNEIVRRRAFERNYDNTQTQRTEEKMTKINVRHFSYTFE